MLGERPSCLYINLKLTKWNLENIFITKVMWSTRWGGAPSSKSTMLRLVSMEGSAN
jgi:hypothetical protein